jgi:hypothetical protein
MIQWIPPPTDRNQLCFHVTSDLQTTHTMTQKATNRVRVGVLPQPSVHRVPAAVIKLNPSIKNASLHIRRNDHLGIFQPRTRRARVCVFCTLSLGRPFRQLHSRRTVGWPYRGSTIRYYRRHRFLMTFNSINATVS